ncbi:MAG: serine/threonine protein kinase [Anaerolineaceae bacterium]|nr:serine/threonine protein kinase [Anaerolineaceae bacterium]
MTDLTNQSIGRYHILEQLGQGGMATVYKAYDTRLEREVAIKVIRVDQFAPAILERILARFEREAKALARLTHPNIVHVNDYGEHNGIPYLVMDYLPGGTLKQLLGMPMPFAQAASLLLPIARALDYSHRRDILHRDVKPSNILLNEESDPLLSDFGVAKILEEGTGSTLTGTGIGLGTPEYMAPEQWVGKAVPASDLYSLGVVFYELVTGHKPYTADTPAAILIKQTSDPLPRPKQYIPDLPDEVERVIFKALAKKPEDRYETMAAFAVALESLVHVQAVAAPGPQPPEPTIAHKNPEPSQIPMQDHVLPAEPETVDIFTPQNAKPQTLNSEKLPRKLWPVFLGLGALILIVSVYLFIDKPNMEGPAIPVILTASSTVDERVALEATLQLTPTKTPVKVTPTALPLEVAVTQTLVYKLGVPEILYTLTGHTDHVSSVAFSPDGSILASGSSDNTIILWDVGSGEKLHTLVGHPGDVLNVAFSPDGNTLASGSRDWMGILWDVKSGEKLRNLVGHTGSVRSVAFSPDGSTLASGSYDNTIILWDASSGEILHTLAGHTGSVRSVAFSPDGSTLASGSYDGTIILWDVKSGIKLRTLTRHTDAVSSVAFSPDGSTLASSSGDGTIILWDVTSGELLQTLIGHTDYVTSVAFSPDGSTLASGSYDDTIILWDASSGEILHTLAGHTGSVRSVAFSPDGSTLASVSYDGTIIIWDLKE